jgi:hypothetical protein
MDQEDHNTLSFFGSQAQRSDLVTLVLTLLQDTALIPNTKLLIIISQSHQPRISLPMD